MGNNPVFNSPWETPMELYAHHIHSILYHQPALGPVNLLMRQTEIYVEVSL